MLHKTWFHCIFTCLLHMRSTMLKELKKKIKIKISCLKKLGVHGGTSSAWCFVTKWLFLMRQRITKHFQSTELVGHSVWNVYYVGLYFLPVCWKELEKPLVLYEGENLRLDCTASGRPEPDLKWIKWGAEPFTMGKWKSESSPVSISKLFVQRFQIYIFKKQHISPFPKKVQFSLKEVQFFFEQSSFYIDRADILLARDLFLSSLGKFQLSKFELSLPFWFWTKFSSLNCILTKLSSLTRFWTYLSSLSWFWT